ncbi:MAG TPA: Asp-tRNA(Asn)/Glu-tRNA(Gln) amidotransferase GatCAB subunit B, partial [Anaerolineae bacterium]|nr:Asp-tRNA(Asn)/Glu-tRNA(Gln) amidotransferase GatCAB subunit B [Anaerolineae bacterium]
IVEARGMSKLSDEAALRAVIADALAAHPDKVAAYRAGKTGLFGFFMGQVMRATRGQADPQVAKRLLEEALHADH